MNVKITTHKNDNEDSYIKGWASVNFNGEFVVNNITIREKEDGTLYAKMPQRNAVQRNEETGLKEKVSVAVFAPANKDAAHEINAAVIDTFKSKGSGSKGYIFDSDVKVQGAKAYYIEQDRDKPTKATLNLDLGDFYVSAAYLQNGKNGNPFVRSHANERNIPQKDGSTEKKYVDDFKPITEKSAREIIDVCVKAYEEGRGNAAEINNKVSLEDFSDSEIFGYDDSLGFGEEETFDLTQQEQGRR